MKKNKKRFLSLALVLVLMLGVLTACGGGKDADDAEAPAEEETEDEEAADDEKADEEAADDEDDDADATPSDDSDRTDLVIATENEPPSVHPSDHNAVAGDFMNKQTFNTLVQLDLDLEVEPSLATEWETDGNEWTFTLRDDVYFHNGDKMTAEDVKASIEYTKTYPESTQYNRYIEEVEVVDENTVKFITDGPYALLDIDLVHHSNSIMPKSLIDAEHDFAAEPIGSGPYKFVEWVNGEKLEFEIFEDYWDEDNMPTIEKITWRIIPEGSSRTIALENGEIDYIVEVATTDVDRIDETDGLETYKFNSTTHTWMMVNNEVAPFDNLDFRKALNAAIDRDAIIQVAQDGFGLASYTQTPQEIPNAIDHNLIEVDEDLAQEYFEASGIDAADAGFSIICSDDEKAQVAQVIQAALKEQFNIDVEIERMDLATYLDVTSKGDYEASIGGYTQGNLLAYMRGIYHSMSLDGSNRTRTNDPKLDEMIEDALTEMDVEAHNAKVTEAAEYVQDLVPQVPLYQTERVRAYNANLGGVQMNSSAHTFYNTFFWK